MQIFFFSFTPVVKAFMTQKDNNYQLYSYTFIHFFFKMFVIMVKLGRLFNYNSALHYTNQIYFMV